MSSRSSGHEGQLFTVVERVRCLDCGTVYAKPRAGGTVQENPGCPDCGYLGWATSSLRAVSEGWRLPRPAAGRRPRRLGSRG